MKNSKISALIVTFICIILVGVLLLYPLDVYVMKPGHAYDVSEYVMVQDGDEDDEGTFSLMTVSMSKATPLMYVYAKLKDYYELLPMNQVRQNEEDEEEYNIRQLKLMADSQFNALYVAFSRAGLEYEVTFQGVYVLNIITGGAADGILKPGDEIVEINGETIESQDMLVRRIEEQRDEGHDEIELVINRNNELLTKVLALKEIPGSEGRVGLGIIFTESKSIKTSPNVNIDTESIGGPSAGLMFTLGILNQLLDEDLTKGYKIAGTGEMLESGIVGRIGGVEKKVVAAHKAGMEIFFAPDDQVTEEMLSRNPNYLSNYEAAVKTAKDIGTTMKIVPVKTIEEALQYLEQLEPKN
ncbi:SepM family pheromone-processing serine protease [Lysinibacillus sp. KU-BSD001]|uniref:SepM family pheromone-processing serine protease n=1 Tax=Lysinibacillus sp. KU-BSD001 TaxID=3141328 RepID=UPI0036EEB13B